MGHSPWSHKELDMTERLSLTHHAYEAVISALLYAQRFCFPFTKTA